MASSRGYSTMSGSRLTLPEEAFMASRMISRSFSSDVERTGADGAKTTAFVSPRRV
jgi:hypothetical protein